MEPWRICMWHITSFRLSVACLPISCATMSINVLLSWLLNLFACFLRLVYSDVRWSVKMCLQESVSIWFFLISRLWRFSGSVPDYTCVERCRIASSESLRGTIPLLPLLAWISHVLWIDSVFLLDVLHLTCPHRGDGDVILGCLCVHDYSLLYLHEAYSLQLFLLANNQIIIFIELFLI